MLLCNPHVQEVAAPVGSVGQSLAGIPTEDIVPRQSSVVSSSTILQLCHRPVKTNAVENGEPENVCAHLYDKAIKTCLLEET